MPVNLVPNSSFSLKNCPHLCPIVTWPTQRCSRKLHWTLRRPALPWDLSAPPGLWNSGTPLGMCGFYRVQGIKTLHSAFFKRWFSNPECLKFETSQNIFERRSQTWPHCNFVACPTWISMARKRGPMPAQERCSYSVGTIWAISSARPRILHHCFDPFWAYEYIVEIWTKIVATEVEFMSWSTEIIAMSLLISAT